jgi:hypothetical protein
MGLRHTVLLQLAGASDRQIEDLVHALRGLPAEIPSLRSYVVGRDAGLSPGAGNYDVAVVADCDDADGFVAYRDHPAHRKVIEEHIKPILTGRAAVQHHT